MATTALFVEILVIGATAEIWMTLLLMLFLNTSEINSIIGVLTTNNGMIALSATLFIAVTYNIGWVINFVAERLIKPYFQKSIRDEIFDGSSQSYSMAKYHILLNASQDLINEIVFDRHIIRIARANVLNFLLIAITVAFNFNKYAKAVTVYIIIVSLVIAVLSFFQWKTRYRAHYEKIQVIANKIKLQD